MTHGNQRRACGLGERSKEINTHTSNVSYVVPNVVGNAQSSLKTTGADPAASKESYPVFTEKKYLVTELKNKGHGHGGTTIPNGVSGRTERRTEITHGSVEEVPSRKQQTPQNNFLQRGHSESALQKTHARNFASMPLAHAARSSPETTHNSTHLMVRNVGSPKPGSQKPHFDVETGFSTFSLKLHLAVSEGRPHSADATHRKGTRKTQQIPGGRWTRKTIPKARYVET